jgi:hypothetical protein
MKIAIIGAGWVGCHLTKVLKDTHQVHLYEASDVFELASSHNQNRLHQGFHYPRNHRTRVLCKDTFTRFVKEYGEFVVTVPKNIYAVAKESDIDLITYKNILLADNIEFTEIKLPEVVNIQGAIATGEMYIDAIKLKKYFKELLKDNLIYQQVINPNTLTKEYDLVINCTNNYLKDETIESYYELTISLVYEKIKEDLGFDALTVVDGNFFSIYPYNQNLYTVTDVQYTPLCKGTDLNELLHKEYSINNQLISNISSLIEKKVCNIYPNFLEDFKYKSYFTAIKSKTYNQTADRYPVINVIDTKVINCFTGKIQGIYKIVEDVKKHIYEGTNR